MGTESEFFRALSDRLKVDLPGEEAQKRLSRQKNYSLTRLIAKNPAHLKSAVMIILWPEDRAMRCLLIRRPVYPGVHSGQVAFPGGKYEEEDGSLLQTAIRETKEEVGVAISEMEVAGTLSPLYIPVSNYLVYPYVSVLRTRPSLVLNEKEVERVLDFELKRLHGKEQIKEKTMQIREGLNVKIPYYEVDDFEVWGATAMIISELLAVLEDITFS